MTIDAVELDTVKVLELKIAKLNLKSGQILAITVPKNWNPRQISLYQHYFDTAISQNFPGVRFMFFPHGFEFTIVTPSTGFTED